MKSNFLILILFFLFSFKLIENDNNPLLLGNPSHAKTDKNNYLIKKDDYTLSYNSDMGIPNWVSWHLISGDVGKTPRTNAFAEDHSLPLQLSHVKPSDYTASGYDRGHQCPSDDRSTSEVANRETFLMSNMIPQTPNLNRGLWKEFESFSRAQAKKGNELYIICGVAGYKNNKVLNSKVHVPDYCWKIIVILPIGDNDLSRINNNTKVFAVLMPNKTFEKVDVLKNYIVKVSEIEQLTGYTFFENLNKDISKHLKSIKGE